MLNTEHENGVLICSIHRTPISKSHGRFFCVKCQRDDKIICDNCRYYQQQPSGTSEACHANKTGSQVIPWLTKEYIDNRLCGKANSCKGFKRI